MLILLMIDKDLDKYIFNFYIMLLNIQLQVQYASKLKLINRNVKFPYKILDLD